MPHDSVISEKRELAEALGITNGIPDAFIANPYMIVLSPELFDEYLKKLFEDINPDLLQAQMRVTQAGVVDLVSKPKSDDPKHRSMMQSLNFIVRTQKRLTQFGKIKEKLAAENKANRRLRKILTEEQWMSYRLTETFWETGQSGKYLYLVRKNRPAIVFRPRKSRSTIFSIAVNYSPMTDEIDPEWLETEKLRAVCALCLHGVGFYAHTFGGLLTPTDDVINFVQLIRADEEALWSMANVHKLTNTEAGIG